MYFYLPIRGALEQSTIGLGCRQFVSHGDAYLVLSIWLSRGRGRCIDIEHELRAVAR